MKQLLQEKKFYVYVYLRKNKSKFGNIGSPYYIGKGHGRRAYDKHDGLQYIPNCKSRILIISSNLNEHTAFEYEKYLIAYYGRIDIKTGILRNMTNGGEGSAGGSWKKPPKTKVQKLCLVEKIRSEANQNISITLKETNLNPYNKLETRTPKYTQETINYIRNIRTLFNSDKLNTLNQKIEYASQIKKSVCHLNDILSGRTYRSLILDSDKIKPVIDRHNIKPNSKLTKYQVIELRTLFETGDYLIKELSKKFNISGITARKILLRKTWKFI